MSEAAGSSSGSQPQACCEFTLRDACIAYHEERPQGRIKVHVIQTNHSHLSGWAPVGFPGMFIEGEVNSKPSQLLPCLLVIRFEPIGSFCGRCCPSAGTIATMCRKRATGRGLPRSGGRGTTDELALCHT